jgi:hypothetical protein
METDFAKVDGASVKKAWEKLHTAGTATPKVAHLLRNGLAPFLTAFSDHFLGPNGVGQGFKLVLGMNGEGKTHLLLCLRELALEQGHPVAMVDAKTAGIDSPFEFGCVILRSIEVPEALNGAGDELPLVALLRSAVERKRAALQAQGLDAEKLLPRWAEGMRMRNLRPHGLADALSRGVHAAIADDLDGLLAAAAEIAFEGVSLPRRRAETEGAQLLRSIPLLVTALELRPIVILVDEAETAVEKKGSARRKEFLMLLRFLNDHVAHGASDAGSAIVVIGCTDECWPSQFEEYEALRQRLSDPARDSFDEREGLDPRVRVTLNKLWVRETFRGDETDYQGLGAALVQIAAAVHPEVALETQRANADRLARVASGDQVKRQVKRRFVKALAQTIEHQVAAGDQRVIEESEAARLLQAAAAEIIHIDQVG